MNAMVKLPKLEHVKYVRSKGKLYAYFNTGQKNARGRIIRVPLPAPSSVGFFDSYAAMKGARVKRQAVSYRIKDLADEYETSTTFSSKSEGTQKYYRVTLRRIRENLGKFPVNDLALEDIQMVLDKAMSGPGAYNAFIAVLGVIYTWARQRSKTTLEPVKNIPKMDTGSHSAWPEHVLEAGLSCAHDRTRLAIHLMYFTGQRIGDVMTMRWSDIRNDAVFVTQQKTGKKLQIHLHRELAAELERTPKRGLTIITNHKGDRMTPQRVRAEIKTFCSSMGQTLVPHGLRKNAVISLLEAQCTIAEVAAITGQTFKIVEQYAAQVDQSKLGNAAIVKFENKRRTGKRFGKPLVKPAENRSIK